MRYLKINTRIILLLFICILSSSLLIILFLEESSKFLTEKYLFKYVESTQAMTSRSIELIIDQAATTLAGILDKIEICSLFEQNISVDDRIFGLRSIITKVIGDKSIIGNVAIIDNGGRAYDNLISNAELCYQDTPFIGLASQSIYPIWGNSIKSTSGEIYLEFGQKLRNYKNGQTIGTLVLYIKESALCNAYHVSNWGESFILANNNLIISHKDKKMVGYNLYDNSNSNFTGNDRFFYKYYQHHSVPSISVIYTINDYLDWKLVTIIPKDKLFVVLRQINNTIFWIETPIIIVVIFIFTMISLRITKPLSVLKQKIDGLPINESLRPSSFTPNDEISALETSYNELISRINELIEKNNQEKERQRELELIALQAQINPHFIYNTLDAIAWLAKLKKQHDIERLVMALATFFRISLHRGEKYITVAEEIDLVKSFVSIEQVRFPGKFNVYYDLPAEILERKMLKIIIQPIVENAIKHGIGKKTGPGEILIGGERDGNLLRFRVVDNGIGMDPRGPTIDALPHAIPRSGYGLRNVDERIKLEYGPEYGIEFQSAKDRGTTVTITIKIIDDRPEVGAPEGRG